MTNRAWAALLLTVVLLAALAAAGPDADAVVLPDASGPPVGAVLAASSPFAEEGDDGPGDAEDRPSGARLDRVAAELRRSPLSVDPELEWMLDARQQRALVRRLRGARIEVLVAVLPSVDEDESGGDTERVLQGLQRRVGRDALYVVVDQSGRMDLASAGVPLDLGIPFSLLYPRYDRRPAAEQERDPAPPGWKTVSARLDGILDAVARARPGTPNAVIDDVDPLEPLTGSAASASAREDAIAAAITGAILGLFAAGAVLGTLAVVRSVSSTAAALRGTSGGGGQGGSATGGRPGGAGRRGSRRGRRGGGRRG